VVTNLHATIGLATAALTLCACQPHAQSLQTASYSAHDALQSEIDERKDEMMRQLAHCESGGSGPSDQPIYGGRGSYLGRFQFSLTTVINYQRRRDGAQLNGREAADLAHDYERAADLAKYMIFELEEPWHWPLCSRKIGLRDQMAHIKTLSMQAQAR
jgi:hypothetical protein